MLKSIDTFFRAGLHQAVCWTIPDLLASRFNKVRFQDNPAEKPPNLPPEATTR